MNRIIILLILLIYIFFSSSSGVFAEDNNTTIKNIQFILTIAKNSEVSVLQKISLENYDGGGITLYLPRKQKIEDKRLFYGIEDIRVSKDGTKGLEMSIEERKDDVKLTVEIDADKYKKAEFTVSYLVERAFVGSGLQDDFILDLIGDKFEYPVKSAEVTVNAPGFEIVDAECFAGDVADRQRMCVSEFDPDEARVASTTALGQGKGLAVQFGIRKDGNLEKPSASQLFFGKAVDYLGIYWKPIVISILIVVSVGWFGRKMFYIKRKI